MPAYISIVDPSFQCKLKSKKGLTIYNSIGKSSLTCIPVGANLGHQDQMRGGSDQMGLVWQKLRQNHPCDVLMRILFLCDRVTINSMVQRMFPKRSRSVLMLAWVFLPQSNKLNYVIFCLQTVHVIELPFSCF